MLTRIGLVFLCFVLIGCSAVRQPVSAPAAAGAPADNYDAQPQAATPLAPTPAAQNSAQQNQATMATSVAATVAAALPNNTGGEATAPPSSPTLASAATVPAARPTTAVVPITGNITLLPLEQLLDYALADSSGLLIGEVKDLVIDMSQAATQPAPAQGAAPYLVVTSHVNDDWVYLIPWQFVQIRQDQGLVLLNTPAAQLQSAPGFHEDAWPGSLPAEWRQALLSYWQNPAQAAALPALPQVGLAAPRGYLRAKELLGFDVVDTRFFELGEIKDIAVDWSTSQPGPSVDSARFAFVIMERDDALGPGAEYIPIPWNRLQLNPQQEIAVLNLSPQVLRSAPAFNELTWPNLYAEPWATNLKTFWK